jgi:hypothetical protein
VSGRHFVFCVRSAIPQGSGIVAGERVGATNASILVRRVGGVKKKQGENGKTSSLQSRPMHGKRRGTGLLSMENFFSKFVYQGV